MAEPNAWQKATSSVTKVVDAGLASDRMLKYQEFFAVLLADLRSRMPSATSASKTQPQSWFSFSAGVSSCNFAWAFTKERRLRVELVVDLPDAERNRTILIELQELTTPLAESIGEALEWDLSTERRSQRVATYAPGPLTIDSSPDELEAVREWAVDRMIKFVSHFRPQLRQINPA